MCFIRDKIRNTITEITRKVVTGNLLDAVRKGDSFQVGVITNNDPDLVDLDSTLQEAARIRNSNFQVVHVLLNAGANPNAQDRDGYTPLELAVDHNNTDVAVLLANNTELPDGGSSLLLARVVGTGNLDMVKEFLESGLRPESGELKVSSGTNLAIIEMLQDVGINVSLVEQGNRVKEFVTNGCSSES